MLPGTRPRSQVNAGGMLAVERISGRRLLLSLRCRHGLRHGAALKRRFGNSKPAERPLADQPGHEYQ
jgi:hypothetical protein